MRKDLSLHVGQVFKIEGARFNYVVLDSPANETLHCCATAFLYLGKLLLLHQIPGTITTEEVKSVSRKIIDGDELLNFNGFIDGGNASQKKRIKISIKHGLSIGEFILRHQTAKRR